MNQELIRKQQDLTARLNRYRHEYYNLNAPSISDAVYDRLFEELQDLERQTGIQMANSPTSTVGYPAISKLEKTNHPIPLLSLDKEKSIVEVCRFMGEHQVMFMLKLDGLTIKLTYEGGELLEAATRGDGEVGEIVTHNTRAIGGIPAHIRYEDRLVITGEAFIRPSDFEQLKASLVDNNGETYKNGRNLAAGSVRLLDAKTCMERRLMFMPFTVLEGFENLPRKSERLKELSALGFTPCKYLVTKRTLTQAEAEDGIKQLQQYARDKDIPIDGIVVTYPQAYAAAAIMLHTLMDDPKAVVLDIGGFTADYLLLKNGKADLTSCDSLENGVILLYNKIRSRGNSELDLLLDESDVDAILAGRKTSYPAEAVRLVERLAQEFVNDLFSTLRERMLDLRYSKVVFVGGGAILLRRQIEASGKVGTPLFVTNINANAAGFEYLYRLETAGR